MFPCNKFDDGSFSALIGLDEGSPENVHVSEDHPQYDTLWQAVKDEDTEAFRAHYTMARQLDHDFEGTAISIQGGTVYYDQTQLDGRLTDKIVDYVADDEPVEHLVAFLDNLMENPSEDSVDQLYDFIQEHDLQITGDGYLIGYKSVRRDYTDHHTGTYDNSVGESHRMPRHEVNDDPNVGCSVGFHVGSLDYAESFHDGPRVMVCKVHPKHIVSVPHSDARKVRVSQYEVVGEIE